VQRRRRPKTLDSPAVYDATAIPAGSLPYWSDKVNIAPVRQEARKTPSGRPFLVNVWPATIVRAIRRARREVDAAATA
jgi:hypothetical protein